jgi:hypothetical protein
MYSRSLTFSDRFFSTAPVPLLDVGALPHDDLLAVLAACQIFEIDLLPIRWQPGQDDIGLGGEARISQSVVNARTSFAFKRVRTDRWLGGQFSFKNLLSEIHILGNKSIRNHSNIAKLLGVCWETIEDKIDTVLPVLVYEKSIYGDLARFLETPIGQALDFNERWSICKQILAGVTQLHSCGTLIRESWYQPTHNV